MFTELQDKFHSCLTAYDREAAVVFAEQLLVDQKITVPQLYEQVITPVLDKIKVCKETQSNMIWKEHVMTNIARTVVECAYPYVLRHKNPETTSNSKLKIIIACPEDEFHDLGARMGSDYFTIENYQVIFIGGNTPLSNVVSVCEAYKPDFLALSVSNFYHIVTVKSIIKSILQLDNPPKIILSGSAFARTDIPINEFGHFALVHSYEQVQQLGGSIG